MKGCFNKIIVVALVSFISLSLNAQDNNAQLWEKGNAFYTTGDFEKAISNYEQILSSGQESAKLYFNLGNAYYKAGNINRAVLNFERAKILDPNDENIDFNIKMANQFVVTSIEPLPLPFFLRWRTSVINMYSSDSWSYISIISFIIFLILIGLFIFSRIVMIRRISFLTGIFILIFSGFAFSFASKQKKKIVERNSAIVFCPRVTVKSAPAQTGTDLFLIYEGLKVQITDSIDTWKEIKLADGNEGWLQDSCIVKI
jgi:tetratricopeptide (TPR) repeat protein